MAYTAPVRRSALRYVQEEGELRALKTKLERYLPYSATVLGVLEMMKAFGPPDKSKKNNNINSTDDEEGGEEGDEEASVLNPHILAPFTADQNTDDEACSSSSSLVIVTPVASRIQSMTVFWSVGEESVDEVARLLSEVPRIDWSRPVYLSMCYVGVMNEMNGMTLGGVKQQQHFVSKGHLYSLDPTRLKSYKLHDDYLKSSLGPGDIETTGKYWNYTHTETPEGLLEVCRHLPTSCVRTRRPLANSKEERDIMEDKEEETEGGGGGGGGTVVVEMEEELEKKKEVVVTEREDESGGDDVVVVKGEKWEEKEGVDENNSNNTQQEEEEEEEETKKEKKQNNQHNNNNNKYTTTTTTTSPSHPSSSSSSCSSSKLVSWTRSYPNGLMGCTFTLPEHRRRGLAAVVTETVCRSLLQKGVVPRMIIDGDNEGSVAFHEALGFRRIEACYLVGTLSYPVGTSIRDFGLNVEWYTSGNRT